MTKDSVCFINLEFYRDVWPAFYFSGINYASGSACLSRGTDLQTEYMSYSDNLSSLLSLFTQCCELLCILFVLLGQLLALFSSCAFSSSSCSSSLCFSLSTSTSVPPKNIIREFFLSSLRRLHLLWTHATRSATTPDWQVLERDEDCRAGEVKSDRVQWDTLALQTYAASSDPLISPTEVSGLKVGWMARQVEECGGGCTGLWCRMLCADLEIVTIKINQLTSLSPSCVQKTRFQLRCMPAVFWFKLC